MSRRKAILLWASGLLILGLLLQAISPAAVGETMRGVDLPLLLVAALLCVASTVLGAFNSHLLLAIDHPGRFGNYLGYFWLAWAFGLVVPGQVGDMGMLSWLMQRDGMRWTRSLGRLFVDKLASLLVTGGIAVFALFTVLERLDVPGGGMWWLLAGLVLAAGALFVAVRVPSLARLLQKAVEIFGESLALARRHPMRICVNLLITCFKVLLLSLSFWYVFKAVGVGTLPFGLLFQLMAVGSIVAYLPLSMNGVGAVEVTAVSLFPLFGVAPAQVLAAYLVARLMVLALAWIPALAGLLFFYLAKRAKAILRRDGCRFL